MSLTPDELVTLILQCTLFQENDFYYVRFIDSEIKFGMIVDENHLQHICEVLDMFQHKTILVDPR